MATSLRFRRGAVLAVVVVAHVAGFVLLSRSESEKWLRELRHPTEPDERITLSFFDEHDADANDFDKPDRAVEKRMRAARPASRPAASQSAITPPTSKPKSRNAPSTQEPAETEPLPAETITPNGPIDWAREAEQVASGHLHAQPDRPKSLGPAAESGDASKRGLASRSPKEFGWSHSRTHRVEPIPGGTLVWLNERCAIVISGMFMPICKMGKIEARGDLFEGMKRPPELAAPPPP